MCHKKVNILRFASLVIAIAVLLSALGGLNVFAAKSGKCGDKLEWSFSGGTLTISGSGAMTDYNEINKAPWYEHREEITAVILPEKLESIGALSFYGCDSLKSIAIPEKVQKIGDRAFYECGNLRIAILPSSLKAIGRSAFYRCEKLEAISLPEGIEKIGDKAFYFCRSIATVTIPESVKSLGNQVFTYCKSLVRVEIKAPLKSIPEWSFYGCDNLAEIKLPDTVTDIGEYAFRRCESLSTIYCADDDDVANHIRKQISEDLPALKSGGYIGPGKIGDTTFNSETEIDKKGNVVSQTNTTVQSESTVTLVTQVVNVVNKDKNDEYTVNLVLTIESDDDWGKAISLVRDELAKISDDYAFNYELNSIKITLYLKGVEKVSEEFLKELAGRNITLEVVSSNGSVWLVDCLNLEFDDVKKDTGISYTVTDASDKAKDKLGTNDCYEIDFETTSKLNTNVVISLPKSTANGNAFLYYVSGGRYKRVQGTAIDSEGNARFYLSSINKNGKYVVGVNVPGESFDDVIISDEASDPFGAIARLEKIEYTPAGPRTLAGFTIGQFTLIVLGVLLFIIIVVGISMYMINKNRPQKFAFMAEVSKKVNTKKPFKKINKK